VSLGLFSLLRWRGSKFEEKKQGGQIINIITFQKMHHNV